MLPQKVFLNIRARLMAQNTTRMEWRFCDIPLWLDLAQVKKEQVPLQQN